VRIATATVLLFAVATAVADPPRPSPEELARKLGDPSFAARARVPIPVTIRRP